jgi:hypothetical protein
VLREGPFPIVEWTSRTPANEKLHMARLNVSGPCAVGVHHTFNALAGHRGDYSSIALYVGSLHGVDTFQGVDVDDLHGVDLHGVDLHGVLHGVDLHGVDLHGVDLHGVDGVLQGAFTMTVAVDGEETTFVEVVTDVPDAVAELLMTPFVTSLVVTL